MNDEQDIDWNGWDYPDDSEASWITAMRNDCDQGSNPNGKDAVT